MTHLQVRIYEFGGFRVDAAKRLLFGRDGQSLSLTPKAFDTLLYLVEHNDAVLEKEELLKAIWPDTIVEENNLNQNISILRRALGESRGDRRYIVTVPGRGYRFVADVRARDATAHPGAASATKTIAVLPFKPLMAEHRDVALELGMADTLIARLSSARDTIVRPISSVRKYVELDQDSLVAGQELGVESVVEGSIQRWGDNIRVTVRLVKVTSGASLWAGTFEEKFTNIFAVQDAIAEKVAAALALQLSNQERSRLTKRYTENAVAYELYLKGRYHWNKLTPPEIRKSIEYFQQAIDSDPLYAIAYAGLAEAYRSLPISGDVPPREAFPKAKAAAAKALELDPYLAEVHASMVFIKSWFDWDWAGAEAEFRRAIEIAPNSAEANRAHAHLLSIMGRHREAVEKGARARELDPLTLLTRSLEGLYLYYGGRDDEASARLTEALELDPKFWIAHLTLAKVYIRKGMYVEAIGALIKARENSGGNSETTSLIGYTWALAGDQLQARRILDELKTLSTQRYVPPHNIAMIYNGLGDKEEAFAWLEKAYDERDVRLAFINVDPKWDQLRSDPRFGNLMQRIGFSKLN